MNFKIQLFILLQILGIVLSTSPDKTKITKHQAKSKLSGRNDHNGHSLKRDAKDQTAVEDKSGQSNKHNYYQQPQHHTNQQEQSEQQFPAGYLPYGQYYSPAVSNPAIQFKEDYGAQYMKNDNGIELNSYGYPNPSDAYQTLAYSTNHPSHSKLASIIHLMAQQLAPIQLTYEQILPQLEQQLYEQPKLESMAMNYPTVYRQGHNAYSPAPLGNPTRSYAYPAHALQYTIVTPVSNSKINSYADSSSQSPSKLVLSPAQYPKYQYSQIQPQQQTQQQQSNLQYPAIYNSASLPNVQLYHPLSQFDVDDKPQILSSSSSNKPGSQKSSNAQYKKVPPNSPPSNHIGPVSFNRFSAHLTRTAPFAGSSKIPPSDSATIYGNPQSQNIHKSQLIDPNSNTGKLLYMYGSHLLHPSDNKVTIHQAQQHSY